MNIALASAAGLLVFMAFGALSAQYLHLEGPVFYIFSILMGALGLSASALLYYFWEKRKAKVGPSSAGPATAGGPGEGGDAARWVREANARLAQSKAGVGIENLPMVFVIGDRGTAKTSILLNSGLEPELLTGQVYQDSVITPTRGANIFYGRDTVFVEAGGSVLANPGAWKMLVAKLQPGRLKSLVGSGGQAPRGVLLCFDLETFARRGAADAIGSAALYLHDRLGDISEVLGISFPVYVLFTRADRIPFFADLVRHLTNEETGQVVGVTLPMRGPAGGVYAETELQRLTASFNDLVHSFCDQRLRLLPREVDPQAVPGAYEFAREFRKLRAMLVQFLVDIARPSQLRASPFLRGFYFSGVRPVVVQDAPAIPQAKPAPSQAEAPQTSGGGRRVPQWLFLGHLFHDVILADGAARTASGSSVKISMTKRILLATVAALSLIYTGLLTISFFGNRSLETTALTASHDIDAMPREQGALPEKDTLVELDTLRQSLQEIIGYETNGRPLRLGFGLYKGADLLQPLRQFYYSRFQQLLFGQAQGQLVTFLQKTPPAPGPNDDFNYGYETLKTYLLTTSEWSRSNDKGLQEYLGSRLLARWSAGRDVDIGKDRMDLAKLQFDFYAQDLHNANPYADAGNDNAVKQGRIYLSQFSGAEWKYQSLLAEAAKNKGPMNFNREFQGSREAVTSNAEVDWAFTREGWTFVENLIAKNGEGEQWVLGPYVPQSGDNAAMAKAIQDRYVADYVKQWREVLRRSAVNPYHSYADASKKLKLLTGSSSPLFQLFWWVSYNTGSEVPGVTGTLVREISDKFKAVQMVVPPTKERQYLAMANHGYVTGLSDLQMAVDRVANKEAGAEAALRESSTSARKSKSALTFGFPVDPEGHIEKQADLLLTQPITNLDNVGRKDTARADVTLPELAGILEPRSFQLFPKRQGESATLSPPPYDWLWGLFRFFANAERTNSSGGSYVFGWTLRSGGPDNRSVQGDRKADSSEELGLISKRPGDVDLSLSPGYRSRAWLGWPWAMSYTTK